jgi:hypothetical protein
VLTSQQIVNLACQAARVPGFTVQAGQILNSILAELCQDYDFDVNRKVYNFTFNSAAGQGSGPYQLPQDYLRCYKRDAFYVIQGVPYEMIPIDLDEFDRLVQTPGLASFPYAFATDLSGTMSGSPWSSGFSPGFGPFGTAPVMYVWPPASGSYPVTLRYYSMRSDIAGTSSDGETPLGPEAIAVVPWFPNQTYLVRRLAGELMALTDDERMPSYLGADEDAYPNGAAVLLRRYLKMKDDKNSRAQTVMLDRRRFGGATDRLRNTKLIGW